MEEHNEGTNGSVPFCLLWSRGEHLLREFEGTPPARKGLCDLETSHSVTDVTEQGNKFLYPFLHQMRKPQREPRFPSHASRTHRSVGPQSQPLPWGQTGADRRGRKPTKGEKPWKKRQRSHWCQTKRRSPR